MLASRSTLQRRLRAGTTTQELYVSMWRQGFDAITLKTPGRPAPACSSAWLATRNPAAAAPNDAPRQVCCALRMRFERRCAHTLTCQRGCEACEP